MKSALITKIASLVCVLTVATFGLAGCGSGTGGDDQTSSGGIQEGGAPSVTTVPLSEAMPESETYALRLTYVNEEYMSEGDDSLQKVITDVSGEVSVESGEGSLDAACLEALRLLDSVPSGTEGLMTVTDQIEISSVSVSEDGTATVDFTALPENGMDNYTEQFLIYQITGTLINSFEDVSSVQFTVAGQQAETIGGHMDATSAYTLSDLESFNTPGQSVAADEE